MAMVNEPSVFESPKFYFKYCYYPKNGIDWFSKDANRLAYSADPEQTVMDYTVCSDLSGQT